MGAMTNVKAGGVTGNIVVLSCLLGVVLAVGSALSQRSGPFKAPAQQVSTSASPAMPTGRSTGPTQPARVEGQFFWQAAHYAAEALVARP